MFTPEQLSMLADNLSCVHDVPDFESFPVVRIRQIPKRFRDGMTNIIEPNRCYNNVFECLLYLVRERKNNIKYVAGVAVGGIIPTAHAWLMIDGVHYDPTWELGLNRDPLLAQKWTYHSVAELSVRDLCHVIDTNDSRPPDAGDMMRSPHYLNAKV